MITEVSTPTLDHEQFILAVLRNTLHTALPGIIVSFDPVTQEADIQPAVRHRALVKTQIRDYDQPILKDVPVTSLHSLGSGYALTCSVSPGDECLLIFCESGIHNWQIEGGVQSTDGSDIGRTYDLSDAIAIIGPSSNKSAITDYLTDGLEMRNRDRSSRITLKDTSTVIENPSGTITVESGGITIGNPGGAVIKLTETGGIQLIAPGGIEMTGDLSVTGNVETVGTLTNNGIGVGSTHVHTSTSPGSPTSPPITP